MVRKIVVLLSLIVVIFSFVPPSSAQQQNYQQLFIGGPLTADFDHSVSLYMPEAYNTNNWQSPVDWTSADIVWRVDVTQKKTNTKLQLQLCFEHSWPDGKVGMEEICATQNKLAFTTSGDTPSQYMKLPPMKNWQVVTNGTWAWNKQIDGIYIHVLDENGNWLVTANCETLCYTGPLVVKNELPLTLDTQAMILAPGTAVHAPWYWNSCPSSICPGWTYDASPSGSPSGGPISTQPTISGPQPTTNPSAIPTILPTSTSGNCINKNIGDADCNDAIGLIDYEFWRREYRGEMTTLNADFTKDGKVSLADFEIWRRYYRQLHGG